MTSPRHVDTHPGFSLARNGPTAVLRLEREHAGNSIDRRTALGLHAELERLEEDPALAVLLVTSSGRRFFCTGGDLDDYRALGTAEDGREMSRLLQGLLTRLERLPAITVAAINGVALGGGCELALACDIRIAEAHAQLSLPQTRLGVIPGWGGTHRLVRTVGRSRAVELLATARAVPADEALALGLVDRVAAGDGSLAEAERLAEAVAANSTTAVRSVKPAIELGDDVDGLAELFGRLWDAPDHREAERDYFSQRSGSGARS
jgi:enoyl-CoA hydratase/carnithine racemase